VLLQVESPERMRRGTTGPSRRPAGRYVTSGAYGHHVRASLALAYVDTALCTTKDLCRLRSSASRARHDCCLSRLTTRAASCCAAEHDNKNLQATAGNDVKVRWHIFLFLFGFAILSVLAAHQPWVAAQNIMPDLQLSQVQIGLLQCRIRHLLCAGAASRGVLDRSTVLRLTYIFVGVVGIVRPSRRTRTRAADGHRVVPRLAGAQACWGFRQDQSSL